MVIKADQERVRALLTEAVTVLCKNGLPYKSSLCVKGLLGITLDEDEVFLIDIRETIKNSQAKVSSESEDEKPPIQHSQHRGERRFARKRKRFSSFRRHHPISRSANIQTPRRNDLDEDNVKPVMASTPADDGMVDTSRLQADVDQNNENVRDNGQSRLPGPSTMPFYDNDIVKIESDTEEEDMNGAQVKYEPPPPVFEGDQGSYVDSMPGYSGWSDNSLNMPSMSSQSMPALMPTSLASSMLMPGLESASTSLRSMPFNASSTSNPVNDTEVYFAPRELTCSVCSRIFTDPSNRRRHE